MLTSVANLFTALGRRLSVLAEGVIALIWLIGKGARIVLAGSDRKAAFLAFAAEVPAQRRILSVLRTFKANLSLKASLLKSYDTDGTALVTRRDDCLDVLHRDADFEVVYGTRMRKLTDGDNFFLGMQPGWDYTRDTSAMHLAMRTTDVSEIVMPRATRLADQIVANADGQIDIVPTLTRHIPWDMTDHYFGVGGQADDMQEWATVLFWYLFEDLPADPDLDTRALGAAADLRSYLDGAIAARHSNSTDAPDLLNRCLMLQSADTPGMSDPGIRNNLLGLLIGAIPTISKASCYAVDELLRRPEALRGAHRAALAGDDATFAQYVWEALRFNPHNPIIYRRVTRDTVIAPGTLRQMRVRRGQAVFAVTLSAMFDQRAIEAPEQFRTNRRWEDYIIWGAGMHTCFGAAINRALIPAILKPLLAQKNLRRAEGAAGQIDTGGTPHPQHFHLVFDT